MADWRTIHQTFSSQEKNSPKFEVTFEYSSKYIGTPEKSPNSTRIMQKETNIYFNSSCTDHLASLSDYTNDKTETKTTTAKWIRNNSNTGRPFCSKW